MENELDEFAYRAFVTDSIPLAVQQKYLVNRWVDAVERKPVDDRTGDEIAADIILRAGLMPKGGEEQ